MEGRIVRVVFDEAHKAFIEDHYRSSFLKVKELAGYPIQKIFLTATLPPKLEKLFLETTCMPSSTLIIRAPTTRRNLRYHVLTLEPEMKDIEQLAKELSALLEEKTFGESSRGIIYCMDIPLTDHLASSLHACKSHSKMESTELLMNHGSWLGGEHKWMVATTGFLHGIDYPDVKAVIFLGRVYGSMNIEQGAGRAGRNGEVANVFVINPVNYIWVPRPDDYAGRSDGECRQHAVEWTRRSNNCRRSGMTDLMDGVSVSCNDLEGAAQCDNCDPENDIVVAARKLLQPTMDLSPDVSDDLANQVLNMDEISEDTTEIASASTTQLETSALTRKSQSKVLDARVYPGANPQQTDTSLVQMDRQTASSGSNTMSFLQSSPQMPLKQVLQPQLSTSSSFSAWNPSSTTPSMSIQLDTALYHQLLKRKNEKAMVISEMTSHLLGKCYICWAKRSSTLSAKTSDHKFFVSCQQPHEQKWVPNATGW